MKKIFLLIFSFSLLFALCGCKLGCGKGVSGSHGNNGVNPDNCQHEWSHHEPVCEDVEMPCRCTICDLYTTRLVPGTGHSYYDYHDYAQMGYS